MKVKDIEKIDVSKRKLLFGRGYPTMATVHVDKALKNRLQDLIKIKYGNRRLNVFQPVFDDVIRLLIRRIKNEEKIY